MTSRMLRYLRVALTIPLWITLAALLLVVRLTAYLALIVIRLVLITGFSVNGVATPKRVLMKEPKLQPCGVIWYALTRIISYTKQILSERLVTAT